MKKIKAWISKDGDKIWNMSFFDTKKEALEFGGYKREGKKKDIIVKAEIIIYD